jgi:hypothetical protein
MIHPEPVLQSRGFMAKRVAILQSSYIPWKGYFDIIHDVDEFIFLDDVQYTTRDWRNRNRIKTAGGAKWLTIPVGASRHRRICDVSITDRGWAEAHWRQISLAYRRTPFFERYRAFFEDVYHRPWTSLSEVNQYLIGQIAKELLGITTRLRDSREFVAPADRQARLLKLLEDTSATTYVSGPAAAGYIDVDRFAAAGIEVVWKDYAGYPEYEQLHPPFSHEVTILDLLFHAGPSAPESIWGWRTRT